MAKGSQVRKKPTREELIDLAHAWLDSDVGGGTATLATVVLQLLDGDDPTVIGLWTGRERRQIQYAYYTQRREDEERAAALAREPQEA